jgi:HSP20 family molecular chaperone IbpA
LKITAIKKDSTCSTEKIQDYLSQKLCQGITIKKTLPKDIETKGFKHTIKNGVLEIIFNKK